MQRESVLASSSGIRERAAKAASAATRMWDARVQMNQIYEKKYREGRAKAEEARAKEGKGPLKRRSGGKVMRLLLLWDVAALLGVGASYASMLWWHGFTGDDWFFWLCVEQASRGTA